MARYFELFDLRLIHRWQKNLLKQKKSFHQDPNHQKTINCRRTVFLLDELHIGDLGVSERHIKARNIFHFLGLRILQRWHRNLLEKKKTFHQDPSHQKTINCGRSVFFEMGQMTLKMILMNFFTLTKYYQTIPNNTKQPLKNTKCTFNYL